MSFAGPRGLQWIPLIGVVALGALITFLRGKKSYIGAACFAVWGLVQIVVLKDPSGGWQSLIAAWTTLGLRAAIAKVSAPPTK